MSPAAPLAGTTSTTAGGGWLFDLLMKAGVSSSTAHTVVEFVFRPLEIVLVVVVAVLVAHFGAVAIRRVLGRIGEQAAARAGSARATTRMRTVVAFTANIWRIVVAIIAIAIALGMLGINLTPLLASATIIGATLGFGAQLFVRDYLAGVLLTIEDQYGIGDTIVVNGKSGVVEDLTLRVTRLRAADGSVHYVPNGDIRELGNDSRGWASAIVDVPIPLGPSEMLDRAKDAAARAAYAVTVDPALGPGTASAPEVVGLVAVDATGCTLRVRLRTTPMHRDQVQRALLEEVIGRLATDGVFARPGDAGATGEGAVGPGTSADESGPG